MIRSSGIAAAVATNFIIAPAVAQDGVNMRELSAVAGEKYVRCLAYNAIRLDDATSSPRDLVIAAKEKCNIVWGMYKFFLKEDAIKRDKLTKRESDIAVEALNAIAVNNASNAVSPLILSARNQNN